MRIEKIVLIEPKAANFHIYSKIKIIRLALPSLAAILKEIGCEVKIYAEEISPINWFEVKEADLVGISSTTSTINESFKIAKIIKTWQKPIVIGGPHVTFEPESALTACCDFVIRGEGEETIKELIVSLRENKPLTNIRGLSYKNEKNQIIHNPDRLLIPNLDSLPDPDFSSFPNKEKLKIIPISTSRGCPFNCEFCTVTTLFGRKYRVRSIDRVINEIKNLNPQPKRLFIVDDNFTANKERSKELLRRMIEEKINIPWSTQVRVDVAEDEELLSLMSKAGCYWVYIGFESINPKSLAEANKKQRVEDYQKVTQKFNKYGINVHGMFVFGFDEDEPTLFQKTVRFASKIKLASVQFLILTPIPGSRLYKKFKEKARIFTKQWSFYDGHHVVFNPLRISAYTLQQETIKAMKKFYSIPRTIKLFLTSWPSKNLWKQIFFRFAGYLLIKKWLKNKTNKLYLNFLSKRQKKGKEIFEGTL
ncbi:MAG: B12-binding domain-containing radical SAM protein [Candidatus Aminicenantia bacterium]